MNNKLKGLLVTLILAISVVFIFFGDIVVQPNQYFFAADGDGFKAYYGAMYHAKHDSSAWRMDGMNYPYGEQVFFTGCQPLIANAIQLISNHIIDISNNVVGIMNLFMIFSIVAAALFLFLLFYELETNWIYASVVSIGICLLSPQIARFGGHFSLSWLFWIPLLLWMLLRFDKKPSILNACLIGIITFFAGTMHMYFYAFFGFVIGTYFFVQFISKEFCIKQVGILFLIQYILPFILFNTLISANDLVTDRTEFPYGFWAYMGHPLGILFPSGKPYSFVPKYITAFRHVSWESLAFIGVTGLSGFLLGLYLFFKKAFQLKNPLKITNNHFINIIFWASFVALLFSFGLPFKFGLESLVEKLGVLRQLRALARFSWLFFYVINIVIFYQIYQKIKQNQAFGKWHIFAAVALAFLFFDGFWNINLNSNRIKNKRPLVSDYSNQLPANKWVQEINPNDYQAILPIPYFHVGSENIWIESKLNQQETTMVASLKTGLPTTGVQLSRTSIGQTYKNYSLVTEPFETAEVLDDLPNQKPFLLFFNRKHFPNEDEKRLISAGDIVYQDEKIELRKLPINKLRNLSSLYYKQQKEIYANTRLFQKDGFEMNDTTRFFIYNSFDTKPTTYKFKGTGSFAYPTQNWTTLLEDTAKIKATTKYKVSFWMKDYKKDGHLRAQLEFIQKDPKTDKTSNYFFSDAHRHIKGFYKDWALIELEFTAKNDMEKIKLSVRNNILKNTSLYIDELLVRENGLDIYSSHQNVEKNTRTIFQN